MRVARDHNRRFLFGIMIPTVLLSVLLLSCRWDSTTGYDRGKTPLVKLNGNVLYAEDLLQVLPLGLTGQRGVLGKIHKELGRGCHVLSECRA